MKPTRMHINIPPLQIPSGFARPIVSPGCPTDSITLSHESQLPWATDNNKHPKTSVSPSLSWTAAATQPPTTTPSTAGKVEPGSYIAFALDTAAVAARFPERSDARDAIRALPAGRYLGYVSSTCEYHNAAGRRVRELYVHYVAAAPPPFDGLTDTWLPIAPSSKLAWTPGCPLLETERMFPWKDRVLWTALGTRLDMTVLHGSSLGFDVTGDGLGLLEDRLHCSEASDSRDRYDPVNKFRFPSYSLAAQVWQDVREADCRDDPAMFVAEVDHLDRLVQYYYRRDNDTDDEGYMAGDDDSTDDDAGSWSGVTLDSEDRDFTMHELTGEENSAEADQTLRVDGND